MLLVCNTDDSIQIYIIPCRTGIPGVKYTPDIFTLLVAKVQSPYIYSSVYKDVYPYYLVLLGRTDDGIQISFFNYSLKYGRIFEAILLFR